MSARFLAAIADYQNPLPGPAQLRTLEDGLREALAADSDRLANYTRPGASADPGDLARATLQHLAQDRTDLVPVTAGLIEHLDPAWPSRPRTS